MSSHMCDCIGVPMCTVFIFYCIKFSLIFSDNLMYNLPCNRAWGMGLYVGIIHNTSQPDRWHSFPCNIRRCKVIMVCRRRTEHVLLCWQDEVSLVANNSLIWCFEYFSLLMLSRRAQWLKTSCVSQPVFMITVYNSKMKYWILTASHNQHVLGAVLAPFSGMMGSGGFPPQSRETVPLFLVSHEDFNEGNSWRGITQSRRKCEGTIRSFWKSALHAVAWGNFAYDVCNSSNLRTPYQEML